MTLEAIAKGKATDKLTGHSYLPIYERLFAPYRDGHEPILEIGAWYGGSLLMWSEWFSRAPIIGVEINRVPLPVDADPRIRIVNVDAYSDYGAVFLRSLGPFAVIVDDGPHTLESQEAFCRRFPTMLAPGGIAIVEDVQDPQHIAALVKAAPAGFETASIDLRHVKDRYDDLLFLIWKSAP